MLEDKVDSAFLFCKWAVLRNNYQNLPWVKFCQKAMQYSISAAPFANRALYSFDEMKLGFLSDYGTSAIYILSEQKRGQCCPIWENVYNCFP